jgi:hypothetical protein
MLETIFNSDECKKNKCKENTIKYFKIAIPILLISGLILIKYTDYFTLGIAFILLSLTMIVIDLYIINSTSQPNLLYISYNNLVKHFINIILINPIGWIIDVFNYLTLNYFISKK